MMKIKEKACYGCNGKGQYTIKYSTGPDIGPLKCDTCKGTGKIKEESSK